LNNDNLQNSVIDADTHVVETERVWDYLEGAEKSRPTWCHRRIIPSSKSGYSTAKISAEKNLS
jgi:predicted oxidoreductase